MLNLNFAKIKLELRNKKQLKDTILLPHSSRIFQDEPRAIHLKFSKQTMQLIAENEEREKSQMLIESNSEFD